MFLKDVYSKGEVVKAGVIPEDLVYQNPCYRPEMQGIQLPHDIWVSIAGIDLVRVDPDTFYVLEDNARTPSGVSYMLENREVMLRLFPELCSRHRIAPVENYADELLATMKSMAPRSASADPTVCLLTPGPFNSAYYEHSFLADKLGAELVEGSDLYVRENVVYMRTTEGPKRVDVIYRRIDDDFIDPLAFRPDSILGVPGLISAYRAGNVTLANAVGTGVADDKAVYSYMPEIIKFYTGRDAILKNVPTWRCREPEALKYVLDHLPELVVKEVDGSGGYGMLVGPKADKAKIETFRAKLEGPSREVHRPADAGALHLPDLRRRGRGAAPRRPAPLRAERRRRRAHRARRPHPRRPDQEGSLVVNSSQGGGTKDTWVVDPSARCPHGPATAAAAGHRPPLIRPPPARAAPRRPAAASGRSAKEPPHAQPHRRQSLLALPLHRARREHRAHHRSRARASPPCPRATAPRPTSGRSALAATGLSRRLPRRLRRARSDGGSVGRLPRLLAAEPVVDQELPRDRAHQRPRRAHRPDRRDVGDDQLRLVGAEGLRPRRARPRQELADFLRFVKRTSLAFDGSAYRTMLRNDAYWFSRLGVFIERSDATARLLDVKYHVLLPPETHVGGGVDYFQWSAVLRAVSAQTSYHWVYRQSLKPWLVADLMILNTQMPRSLAACYESLTRNLDQIAQVYGRQGSSQRAARAIYTKLVGTDIDTIIAGGLHEFLSDFITENNRLGGLITEQYLL